MRDVIETVYLITALLYGTIPAVGTACAMAGTIAGLWFLLPFPRRDMHVHRPHSRSPR